MLSTDIAWAAGILDGEGCIHIRKNSASESTKHATTHYALIVKVTMTHKPTIDRLNNIFGVGYVRGTGDPKESFHKQGYGWYVSSRQAEECLRLMRPFLTTKADEADEAIYFMSLGSGRGGKRRTSPELLALREASYNKLRELKRKH